VGDISDAGPSRTATDTQQSNLLEVASDSNQPDSQIKSSPLTSLSTTTSDSGALAQSSGTSEPEPGLTPNDETLFLLHGSRIDLHAPEVTVNLKFAILSSQHKENDVLSQEGSDGVFQSATTVPASFEWGTSASSIRPGYFSRTRIESGTAAGQEATQGIGLDTQATHAITIYLSSSATTIIIPTTTTGPISPNIDPNSALDGSGLKRTPSRKTLGVIFGSVVGASIFAGCFFAIHRLCLRHCRNVGIQKHAIHNAIHAAGPEPMRSDSSHPEISRFSQDS
jgi:hypothetical protein